MDTVETRAYLELKIKQKATHIERERKRLEMLKRLYAECGGRNQ